MISKSYSALANVNFKKGRFYNILVHGVVLCLILHDYTHSVCLSLCIRFYLDALYTSPVSLLALFVKVQFPSSKLHLTSIEHIRLLIKGCPDQGENEFLSSFY